MPKVFKSITRLIYYSNGGFSYSELYSDVPVYVRRFLIGEIEDIKKKEKEAMESDNTSSGGTASSEDISKAMDEMKKKAPESTGDAEKDLEKVFGPKEERERQKTSEDRGMRQKKPEKRPSKTEKRQSSKNQKPPKDQTEESSKTEEDPAKAEDLEQMIDKLKQDI